jgi:transposase InsO family protein
VHQLAEMRPGSVVRSQLQEWEDYYNYHRPHGRLGGQTPYERLKQKTTTQP